MYVRKFLFCIWVSLTVLSTKAHTQNLLSFQLGCLGFDNATTPVSTSPVIFHTENCFQLQNGVALLFLASPGPFIDHCNVWAEKTQERFEIKLMPNPVASTLTIMLADNESKLSNTEGVILSLFDEAGRLLKTNTTEALLFKTGFPIDMSRLPAGTYVLKLQLRDFNLTPSSIIKIK